MKKIFLALLVLLFPLASCAHYGGDDLWGRHMMDMGSYGFFGAGIFIFIFWILLIIGIVYLVKYMAGSGKIEGKKSDRSMEILKERYAKGEISKEEFEKMKKDLE